MNRAGKVCRTVEEVVDALEASIAAGQLPRTDHSVRSWSKMYYSAARPATVEAAIAQVLAKAAEDVTLTPVPPPIPFPTPRAIDPFTVERDAGRVSLQEQQELRREISTAASGGVALPELLTLRQRLARPRRSRTWRVEGLQGVGHRTVFYARYKLGKTTVVGNLLRSFADNVPFLGREICPLDGTVAVLDFEMSAEQLDDWYRDLAIEHDDRIWPVTMRNLPFNVLDAAVRAAWATELRARQVRYLVLDCLRPMLDRCGLDEQKQIGQFLTNGIEPLLAAAGIDELLLVHHAGYDGRHGRGDSRIGDWPDAMWSLIGDPDNPEAPRYFAATGRDVHVPKTRLHFDAATRRVTLPGGAPAKKSAAVDEALASIVQLLTETDGLSKNAIESHPQFAGEHGGEQTSRSVIRAAMTEGVRRAVLREADGPKAAKVLWLAR